MIKNKMWGSRVDSNKQNSWLNYLYPKYLMNIKKLTFQARAFVFKGANGANILKWTVKDKNMYEKTLRINILVYNLRKSTVLSFSRLLM